MIMPGDNDFVVQARKNTGDDFLTLLPCLKRCALQIRIVFRFHE